MSNKEIKDFLDKKAGQCIAVQDKLDYIVQFRFMYYYFCFRISSDVVNYTQIGQTINRTHATVMNGIRQFHNRYETDKRFRNIADKFQDEIMLNLEEEEITLIREIDSIDVLILKSKYRNLMVKNKLLSNKLNWCEAKNK